MVTFTIDGERKVSGSVAVRGMKNATTPILAATILTAEPCRIHNIPDIADVARMLEILKSLGARVVREDPHTVTVTCGTVHPDTIDQTAVKKMRSSVLIVGPLLARSGEVEIVQPGGCIIGVRPIDVHLAALKVLGAAVERTERGYRLTATRLTGAPVVLPEFSVTATENLLMAAATAAGTTTIKLAATEPNVQDLARFLVAMGADIDGIGTHTLTIRGRGTLAGAEHTVIPDQIEIGTFAVAAAATLGTLAIHPVVPDHLDALLLKLTAIGVPFDLDADTLTVKPPTALASFRLQAMPYPGFPTDLQPPFSLLATMAQGTSLIHDPLYEGRLGYVAELIKMGANATVCDPHRVLITGPTPLYGQEIKSYDLRAGATLILAGLVAKGRTVIQNADDVDRGYERFDERLRSLGAAIERHESVR